MKDESAVYTDENARDHEVRWVLAGTYRKIVAFVAPRMKEHGLTWVLEFGCGPGLVAAGLAARAPGLKYGGVDASRPLLARARLRCPKDFYFEHADVRAFVGEKTDVGLVMAWSLFKHLGLDEWDGVVSRLLRFGRFAAFNVQLFDRDLDDGVDFPHVRVTEERLDRTLALAGHEALAREEWGSEKFQDGTARDVVLWTKKRG